MDSGLDGWLEKVWVVLIWECGMLDLDTHGLRYMTISRATFHPNPLPDLACLHERSSVRRLCGCRRQVFPSRIEKQTGSVLLPGLAEHGGRRLTKRLTKMLEICEEKQVSTRLLSVNAQAGWA